ncbi:MAG: hypothetical protein AAGD88_02620 [Bacteroidota bacterium]
MTRIILGFVIVLFAAGCGQQSAEDVLEGVQSCNRFQLQLEAFPTTLSLGETGIITIRVINRVEGFDDFIEPNFSLKGVPINERSQYLSSTGFSLPQITPNSNDATLLDFTVSETAPTGPITFEIQANSVSNRDIDCSNEIVVVIVE